MDSMGVGECIGKCLYQPHASGLMSLQFGSGRQALKPVGVCSLDKRWLWVTPRIPNVNNKRNPSVMKCDLLVQPSKSQGLEGRHVGVRDRTQRRG